ncbi:MAG: hypothetical protein RSD49_22445 [Hafnia sp.]
MSINVKINGQTFSIHDRFQNLVASVAVGEEFAIWDDPISGGGKHVKVTSITTITNDDLTVSQYIIEGTDTTADINNEGTKDVNDSTLLFGISTPYKTVKDTLAFNYAHLSQGSLLQFENNTYRLYHRLTNIVNYNAPLGNGLSSRLRFVKK